MEIVEITKGSRGKVLILQSEISSIETFNKSREQLEFDMERTAEIYFFMRRETFRGKIERYEILKDKYNRFIFDKGNMDYETIQEFEKLDEWIKWEDILFTYKIYTLKNWKSYNTYNYIIEIKDDFNSII